jgi:hypothetical protein
MRDNQGLSVIHSQPSRKASLLQRMKKMKAFTGYRRCALGRGGKNGIYIRAGGARHCGASILRRYAATSALLQSMANLSAVLPILQRRKSDKSKRHMASALRTAQPGPRSDVCFPRYQQTAVFKAAITGRLMQWSVMTGKIKQQ